MFSRLYIRERRGLVLAVSMCVATVFLVPSACGSSPGSSSGAIADASVGDDVRSSPLPEEEAGPNADAANGLPSLSTLIADDSIWTLVNDPGTCALREARVAPDPFPARQWSDCGAGCRVSLAALKFQEPTQSLQNVPSGEYVDGDVVLLLPLESGFARIVRAERLSDGATLAAVLDRGPHAATSCFQAHGGAAPFLFAIGGGAGGGIRFGRAPHQPGSPIAWHSKWLTNVPLIATERFEFDGGYGLGTDGTPVLFTGPSDTAGVNLVGSGHVAHGMGHQLVWGGTTGSIRSYTAAGGSIDLVPIDASRTVHKLRLSADRMVWISAARNGDAATDARWHWSPRATDAAGIVVHDGPPLSVIADGGTDMQVGGEWAATVGSDGTASHVYVWHITTGETWVLPNRPGFHFRQILAVSPTEIVLGEAIAATDDHDVMPNLVRIDLAALPALSAAWSK